MNYALNAPLASDATLDERTAFIRRTYAHLGGAMLAFVALCAFIQSTPAIRDPLVNAMLGSRAGWAITLGLFIGVSWFADRLARSEANPGAQYAGLGASVVAQALIFTPLLAIASTYADKTIVPAAGLITALVFAGLTGFVFVTKKDFSFLRGILAVVGMVALGAIACSLIFNFTLPSILFSSLMIAYAGGSVLYTTSNILRTYHTNSHVAASLALFAAVALMLWYVIQLLMSLSRR
jgi:hypothetical protein